MGRTTDADTARADASWIRVNVPEPSSSSAAFFLPSLSGALAAERRVLPKALGTSDAAALPASSGVWFAIAKSVMKKTATTKLSAAIPAWRVSVCGCAVFAPCTYAKHA